MANPVLDIKEDKILILDFGSQFTQLIARRVREQGVYCEIHSCEADETLIRNFDANGIILSGGPESVVADEPLSIPDTVFDLGIPVFGICYGMQAVSYTHLTLPTIYSV